MSLSVAPAQRPISDATRRRLATVGRGDTRSWLATGVVGLIATILRFVGLESPRGKMFDEIYYATEGHDIYQHGVEWLPSGVPGQPGHAKFVVHPPLGKWIIGGGEAIFGQNEFGWRVMSAIAGVLTVVILVRVGRRLFRSTLLGCAAGLLMSLDGMHFVLSRTALLDIFLLLFVLAGFAFLLLDRDLRRAEWLRVLENGGAQRPMPYYRLAAGFFLGAACGVKWSGVWFLALFLGLMVVWSYGLRSTIGIPLRGLVKLEAGWVIGLAGLAFVVYLATWTGWFATNTGWDRTWAGPGPFNALRSLLHYHHQMLFFHEHLATKHPYQSWPWQWLLLGRPVRFYFRSVGQCGGGPCASDVLMVGTPLLWWSFIPAIAATVWLGMARRDWRAWTILLGIGAGILPWFKYELDDRTMFAFYALPAEPFLILAVVYVFGALIRPAWVDNGFVEETKSFLWYEPRLHGALALGAYVLVIALCFAYFYPILTGGPLSYNDWYDRMWLGNRWAAS